MQAMIYASVSLYGTCTCSDTLPNPTAPHPRSGPALLPFVFAPRQTLFAFARHFFLTLLIRAGFHKTIIEFVIRHI